MKKKNEKLNLNKKILMVKKLEVDFLIHIEKTKNLAIFMYKKEPKKKTDLNL